MHGPSMVCRSIQIQVSPQSCHSSHCTLLQGSSTERHRTEDWRWDHFVCMLSSLLSCSPLQHGDGRVDIV